MATMATRIPLKVVAGIPKKLLPLFEKSRYKVIFGGRGGGKSWNVARILLILGSTRPLRILCAREYQKTISESVHQLLVDQIQRLGLQSFYHVTEREIRGINGTQFYFCGLKSNPEGLKSYEGVDICWIEEAALVTKRSWGILLPTIRKAGSEIWLTFNPSLEKDETYQRFVLNPPRDCIKIKINWYDNQHISQELVDEKDHLKKMDYDAYLNIWEGTCKATVDGAVYGREMLMAEKEGRIMTVPYDKAFPVYVVCDLGYSDATAFWFVQFVAMEIRVIKYIEDVQRDIQSYLVELQKLGYLYDTIWLPHDSAAKRMEASGISIEMRVRNSNLFRKVYVLGNDPENQGIDAARSIFNRCYFDKNNCADGLSCLRNFRYNINEKTETRSPSTVHDNYSHGADAFRYLAVAVQMPRERKKHKPLKQASQNWMA